MSVYVSKRFLTNGGLLLLFLACQPNSNAAKTEGAQKQGIQKAAIQKNVAPKSEPRQLSIAELVEALREAKVVDASSSLSATRVDDELLITTERNPKLDVNGTKVQAVLIAKTAFDLIPESVQRNKIIFHDLKDGTFSQVVVNRTEITSYGKGDISEKTLLGSLELEKKSGEDASTEGAGSVVDGPLKSQRAQQLTDIEFMKSKGANLSKLEEIFTAQEKAAEAGDSQSVQKSLKQISAILNEQRSMLKSAQQAATGQGPQSQLSTSQAPKTMGMIEAMISFLRSRGVSVDAEYAEAKRLENEQGSSAKQGRGRLMSMLRTKLSRLSAADQQNFRNSLLSNISSQTSHNRLDRAKHPRGSGQP